MAEFKKADLKSMDIPEDKLRQLKQVFPEVFTEGLKVDPDKLRLVLGENLDTGRERFGMNWPGKADCFKIIQAPSVATLIPARSESVNFDTTENLFIEGDNLEVLKLLQKSYYGKIKMIYIDPPYNTGNEFIYPDNYAESLDTYLRYSGQIDDDGRKYSTNAETDGRFHSKWLNMMYPRLYLDRNLLRDDGVIFISIDDNEVSNLRKVCDEIFGEENSISLAGWQKVYSSKNQAQLLSNDFEFVLIYAKNISNFKIGLLPRTEDMNNRYQNPDNDTRGDWKPGDLVAAEERKGGHFIVRNPITRKEYDVPSGKHWAFSEPVMKEMLEDNRVYFGKNNDSFPSFKQFLNEVKQGRVASSLLLWKDYGHTDEAKKDFIKIFGEEGKSMFETLKPVRLIQNLSRICNIQKLDIILDFFAGSGTTAHAVLDMNKQDSGSRKFILVQLPESCAEDSEAFKAGCKTIADICKERVRRVIKKIKEDQAGQLDFKQCPVDMGFKVFKLAKSNFKVWEGDIDPQKETVEKQLEMHVDHINPKSSQDDILFELLLKAGFELTTKIEKIPMAGKTVYSVEGGLMLICLEKELTQEVIKAMAEKNPSRVICLDQGFSGNDQLKTNAVQIMKSKGVEDFRTV